jgi:ABC-type nickel/cobalt efflux system permease component RcnA
MKRISICIFLLLFVFIPVSIGSAHNPFTAKPENQHMAPKPLIKSKFFVKIIFWQQQLREKMSKLIREAKTKKSLVPFFILIVSAFAYGVIHSAGPGHGKAVALSYILSCKPSFYQGLIFGNLVAFAHGFSGIFFVLTVKYLLQTGFSASLESMTSITQIVSYSLITCLGLIIFFRSIYKWIKNKTIPHEPRTKLFDNPFITAIAVGIIPCPGVVMVMLFAISLDLIWLGILLGITISLGMASTITLIVMAGMSGKAAVLSLASNHRRMLSLLEHIIEAAAGLLVACLGFILLSTNL